MIHIQNKIIILIIILLIIIIFLCNCTKIKENLENIYNINDDLKIIFKNLKNYVIIRCSNNFPIIKQGSDIDILTTDLQKNYDILKNLKLNIFKKKDSYKNKNVRQIDLYLNEKFFVKFDFTDLVINDDKFSLHNNLTYNIINNRVKITRNNLNFFVPNKIDDIAIRYCEYKSKNKTKHLKFVKNSNILFNKLNEDSINYNINYNEKSKQNIHKFNYFLIWPHGVNNIVEIMDMINDVDDLKIIHVKKIKNNNLDNLINNIYKFELENSSHIKSKTQYLKKIGNNEIIIILCLNENYNEHIGKVKYCTRMNDLKWKIREKFNPLHKDKNFYITKLSKGITHNHIIHGNDEEKEVYHMFDYLKLGDPFKYIKNSNITEKINSDFHLAEFSKYSIEFINMDNIRCNIVNKQNIKIEDSPHYKFVNGNENEYINYFKYNTGTRLTQNHTPNRFRGLIKNFDYKNYNKNNYYLIIVDKNYIIQDGLHRASILKKNNIKNIKVVLL